ncbi:NAD(P)/FAD-dependent oxidoreductase [Candidatus Omnitrophota bacterium]
MKKVAIIGGGFAGLSALAKLSRVRREVAVTLFDQKPAFDFLPALPDVIGERIPPEFLSFGLAGVCAGMGAEFINDQVTGIDLSQKSVRSVSGSYEYDYLVIASGTKADFYGNSDLEKQAYRLDSIDDARMILGQLKTERYDTFIIAGGGYTGIEIATNIRRFYSRRRASRRVIIVERSGSILGPLPSWMKEYTSRNLRDLDIEVLAGTTVEKAANDSVALSGGQSFEKAMLIWAAGVKTGSHISDLAVEKNRQGRLGVDKYLRIDKNTFAVGDAGQVIYEDIPLRMSIQFALTQGRSAGANLLRCISNKELRAYIPVDLGYIVPMANNASCGLALGFPVKGIAGMGLHYFFCVFRSRGFRNRWGIIKSLCRSFVPPKA